MQDPDMQRFHEQQALSTRVGGFHERVDRLAKLMCEEFGVDPMQMVSAPLGHDRTPWESDWNPTVAEYGTREKVQMHRWRTYRRQAAINLAAWYGINKLVLAEA